VGLVVGECRAGFRFVAALGRSRGRLQLCRQAAAESRVDAVFDEACLGLSEQLRIGEDMHVVRVVGASVDAMSCRTNGKP
jgi:hypothetical protein